MTRVAPDQRWHRRGVVVYIVAVLGGEVVFKSANLRGTKEGDVPKRFARQDFLREYEYVPPLKGSLWRNMKGEGLVRVMADSGWNVTLYNVKTKVTRRVQISMLLRGWVMVENPKGMSVEKTAWDRLMEED